MTQVISRIDDLRTALTGTVVTPDDPGYDKAREVWNGDIDRRPAVVAYCESAEDVARAVVFARDASLEVSVRSGGAHSGSGMGVGDAGIAIDLSRINDVVVDPEARRAVIGGGALQRDIDAATQAHGLAVPLGEIGHTGVGGIATGGGMGWLTRQHGLTCDNIVAAQVVLADGRIVRAAPGENPDLFWAIRGGGGNFGVVTAFEVALHDVGPQVELAMLFYGMDDAGDALRVARDLIPDLPPDVSFEVVALHAPPEPFVPEEHRGRLGFALAAVGFGSEQSHRDVVDRVRRALPPALFELITPMPYAALQQMFDEAFPWGTHTYVKALYLEEFTDRAIDVIVEQAGRMASPMSALFFYVLSGAFSSMDEQSTAFGGGRSPRLSVFILGMTPGADGLAEERVWVRGFYDALAPLALGKGAYVNEIMPDDIHRLPASYGDKFSRLQRIKAAYDPDNVFHRNANIIPAT
ncbi:FAD/FMN-containing dehydrogenase [Actinomycetospora succinea]|uniref:FAD/FMN-containing dehydrogenase n=1 Tax=Actinomycetospora succinea TaxID=663603 RepID=A0A4R6VND4_9PSEU|nr:FAD-binding oxidoreductase [Actinomycetospora succinea]TDQ65372.1 FAD/FMN-containing dehydrogenase [Actinomycetospora succinea]